MPMRTSILLLSFVFVAPLLAQDCSIPFTAPLFDVQVESDILYGSAPAFNGQNTELRLNLYKPVGDGQTERPLIVLVHGGGFTGGSRNELNDLCATLASQGWAAATISYRLGFYAPVFLVNPFAYDQAEVVRAAYRSIQDTKGAIRFLKGRSAQDSTSTENVIALGFSAGGIASLHSALVTEAAQRPPASFAIGNVNHGLQQYPRPDLGDVDGPLNQNGQDASVIGVISFFGGLLDTSYVTSPNGPALWLYHQTQDPVVGCGHQQGLHGMPLNVGGNYPMLHGSCSIDDHCGDWGWAEGRYRATIHNGNGHDIHDGPAMYADAVQWARDLICGLTTGVADMEADAAVRIFPNPTTGTVQVEWPGEGGTRYELLDATGRMLGGGMLRAGTQVIDLGGLPDGLYFLRMGQGHGALVQRLVLAR